MCLSKRLQDWPFKVYMRWQDRTCQATAEQQERCVVEVGPHTLAETESVWWVGYHCCSQCCCLHLNTERKFSQPTHGCWRRETQICLVLEAFLLYSGNLELCLHPQAHLLACQRRGNSFSPSYCLLEGVRLSPDSLGT